MESAAVGTRHQNRHSQYNVIDRNLSALTGNMTSRLQIQLSRRTHTNLWRTGSGSTTFVTQQPFQPRDIAFERAHSSRKAASRPYLVHRARHTAALSSKEPAKSFDDRP